MKQPKKRTVSQRRKPGSQKTKPSRASDLSVVIVREVGKVHTFKISSRFLLWSSLFFAFFIVASVVVINLYFEEIRQNRYEFVELERLQNEMDYTKRAVYRSQQHLALLEDYLSQLDAGGRAPASHDSQDELAGKSEGGAQGPLLEVRGIVFRRKGAEMAVDFRLVNLGQEKAPVSGYAHIIATDKGAHPPRWWAYPKEALLNGLPVNYKEGQEFHLKRVKIIQGTYTFDADTASPSSIKVLVYNKSGELISEREFEPPSSSQKNP